MEFLRPHICSILVRESQKSSQHTHDAGPVPTSSFLLEHLPHESEDTGARFKDFTYISVT